MLPAVTASHFFLQCSIYETHTHHCWGSSQGPLLCSLAPSLLGFKPALCAFLSECFSQTLLFFKVARLKALEIS